MRTAFIILSALILAIAAADASAQRGGRRGGGTDRAAKAQEKPQESVDQLALILAELQEDLKLTANQQAVWDAYARNVEALASDVARERGRTKEVMQMKVLQRLDHAAIFVLIAGTFTPALGLLFTGLGRWAQLLVVWSAAAAGISLKRERCATAPVSSPTPDALLLRAPLFKQVGWGVILAHLPEKIHLAIG